MAVPFRRISNVANDSILQQFQKSNINASPSNKENFPISSSSASSASSPLYIAAPLTGYTPAPAQPIPVEISPITPIPPAPAFAPPPPPRPPIKTTPEIGVRFAEPYTPQKNEFHPVPILMGIEFVEVCTGPPWSVGDSLEIQRRKEIENYRRLKAVQEARVVQPPIVPTYNLSQATYNLSQDPMMFQMLNLSMPNYTLDFDDAFSNLVLSTMIPSANVFEYSRRFTHVTIAPKVTVPLTYVRAKIPDFYADFFLNEDTATHILHMTSLTGESASMPIHDLVLVAQCLEIWRLVTLVPSAPKPDGTEGKPGLFVENVPHLEAFGVLLRWLYTNDEDELYETLEKPQMLNRDELLLGFAQNCQFWGVIDTRVLGVVRAILEGNRDMCVPSQQYIY